MLSFNTYLVEVRRVELLSKKPSIPVSPSADCSINSLKYFKQSRKYFWYPLNTHYFQGKNSFVSYVICALF